MAADALVADAIQEAVESATGPTRAVLMLMDTLTKDPAQAVEFVVGLPADVGLRGDRMLLSWNTGGATECRRVRQAM